MRVTRNSCRLGVWAAPIFLGVVVIGVAICQAGDPPAPAFNHPMGPSTKASPLLRGCGLPLFDAEGNRAEQGGIGCGTCHGRDADGNIDTGELVGGRSASALCAACHKSQAKMAGSAHVMDDGCLACHQLHAEDGAEDLWTAGLEEDAEEEGSAACLGCHDDPGWGSWPRWQLPAGDATASADKKMTLIPRSEPMEAHEFGCNECHNPHAAAPNKSLLKNGPDDEFATLCLNCHDEELARLAYTYHSPGRLSPANRRATLCGACHAAHGPGEDDEPAPLVLSIPASLAGAFSVSDCTCLACHATGRSAGQATSNYTHPAVPMVSRQEEDAPGFYPLIDKGGELGGTGRLGCLTCHLPHGREVDLDDLSAEDLASGPAGLPPAVPLTRRYAEPNLCSDCHSRDALQRFLYFHKPRRLAPAAQ